MSKSQLMELEKRVDLALKGMNLLLFSQAESISKKEKNEVTVLKMGSRERFYE